MSFGEISPVFQKWLNKRAQAQKSSPNIPTRNANPTNAAGPKNSIGPVGGSAKSSVTVVNSSNGKKKETASKGASPVTKTGVPNLRTTSAVGRPKGKVRAQNNPSLSSRIG